MVKTIFQKSGFTTALIAIGWISFIFGMLIQHPLISIPLCAIARALP